MKYIKKFEKSNNEGEFIVCKLNRNDIWDRNYKLEDYDTLYVVFKIIDNNFKFYSDINMKKLQIIYEYVDGINYSDRRQDKKDNIEYMTSDKIKDRILLKANSSKEAIELLINTTKYNL